MGGNQQIQLILLRLVLIIFPLVSLLSSVDGRTNFAKIPRKQQTVENVVEAKQSTVETAAAVEPPPPAQPLFYQQSKEDNNPHGLNPHTHTPPPPPPTYTPHTPHTPPTPPPPTHHGFGFPNNYDPNYYVTRADNADQPAIIEDEKKEQANKYDDTNFLDEDEDEEDEEDLEDLDNLDDAHYSSSAPPPPSPHGPASRYVNYPTFTTTKTDHNYKTKYSPTPPPPPPQPPQQQGMSDTRFMANGRWAYNLDTETFTSAEHPFNQQNTIQAEDEDPLTNEP